MESKTQGSRPRPSTQKNLRPRPRTALPRTDPLEARAMDQEHKRKCSLKKRSSRKFFKCSPKKKGVQKFFQAFFLQKNDLQKFFSDKLQNFNNSRKQCCPRADDRVIFENLRLQGQGLDLRDQDQGLQNVASKTPLCLPTPQKWCMTFSKLLLCSF